MGPISTGLGEVYWWSVEYVPPSEAPVARRRARLAERWLLSHARGRAPHRRALQRIVYLRTVQDWIIRPQMKTVPGVAGADAIGGYVKQYQVEPDPARLVGYGISFSQIADAIEANNVSRGANYIERNGEGYVVRTSGRVERLAEIGDIVVATRSGVPGARQGCRGGHGRARTADRQRQRERARGRARHGADAGRRQQPHRCRPPPMPRSRRSTRPCRPASARRAVLNRTELVDATIHTVATNLAIGALLVILVLFLHARQLPRRADHGAGHSDHDADHGHRHAARAGSAPTS